MQCSAILSTSTAKTNIKTKQEEVERGIKASLVKEKQVPLLEIQKCLGGFTVSVMTSFGGQSSVVETT